MAKSNTHKYVKKCPVCGAEELKNVFNNKWKDSNFVECTVCGLIFQNPQEPLSKTMSRYDKKYFDYELANQHNFFNLVKKTLDDFRIIKKLKKGSDVLEIGSATGLFLKYMDSLGFRSTGIEVCRESIAYGRKNYNVNLLNCRLEEAGFGDSSFDFIHFSHLIEHLNDPVNFLGQIHHLLKKNGHAVLTTPNSGGLFSRIYNENWRCIVNDHLFLFNLHNLKLLLEKKGFRILNIKTWGSIPRGKAPGPVKYFFDVYVKLTGTGDVVSFLVKKV